MANVWSTELTLEFIQLYKDETVLWDPNNPYHKNRLEVAEAWNRVQANLSETFEVEDLKRKKESIMSSYRVQIRKKRKSHGKHRPTWFAFPLMDSFLGNLDQFEYEDANSSQDTDNEYLGDQDYKPPVEFVTQKPSTPDKKYHVVFNSRTPNHKRQSVNTSYESSGTYDQATTSGVASTAGMDECDLYTHLLAKKLRRLDEEQRDMAMHAIDNIMFQAKATMRNKSAKLQRQRKTKPPMFILSQANDIKCYDENDPMDDEIDETVETLEEFDDE